MLCPEQLSVVSMAVWVRDFGCVPSTQHVEVCVECHCFLPPACATHRLTSLPCLAVRKPLHTHPCHNARTADKENRRDPERTGQPMEPWPCHSASTTKAPHTEVLSVRLSHVCESRNTRRTSLSRKSCAPLDQCTSSDTESPLSSMYSQCASAHTPRFWVAAHSISSEVVDFHIWFSPGFLMQ